MDIVLGILIGAGVAAGLAALAVGAVLRRQPPPVRPEELARRLADEQRRQAVDERDAAIRVAMEHFGQLSRTALESERTLHGQELESKKSLIDQQLGAM